MHMPSLVAHDFLYNSLEQNKTAERTVLELSQIMRAIHERRLCGILVS